MESKKRRARDVLLGFFVLVGIALLFSAIFFIGKERRLFDRPAFLYAQYPNVAGLAVGADVLLAGVIVGQVSAIRFPEITQKQIEQLHMVTVEMRISNKMLPWIRQDSLARVDSKGLLGDKTINISLGSAEFPASKNGDLLTSVAPIDFNEALGKAQKILDNVTDTIGGAKKLFEGFSKAGGDKAIADAANSIKNITAEIENGAGVIHHLVYDKKAGTNYQGVFESIDRAAKHIAALLKEAETGQGLVHALLYDPEGAKAVKNLTRILGQVDGVLGDIKNGKGILHDLIYESSNQQLVANLNEASADLKTIVAKVKNGEGTIGRLLVDPTVYEDLKQILSKIRRNEVLKAVIRYSVSKKESDAATPKEEQ